MLEKAQKTNNLRNLHIVKLATPCNSIYYAGAGADSDRQKRLTLIYYTVGLTTRSEAKQPHPLSPTIYYSMLMKHDADIFAAAAAAIVAAAPAEDRQ